MNTDELLEKIHKRFDTLEKGQAHTNSALEAVKAGQDDLREKVVGLEKGQKAIREEMATKADIHDLRAEIVKKIKQHDKRIDALEEKAGIPNPYKD